MHRHKNRGERTIPRGDKTGPMGAGPKTGRAAGYCAGYNVPGFMSLTGGYGRGWVRGRGRGWGRGRYAIPPPAVCQVVYPQAIPPAAQPQAPEQEVAALENYQKQLEAEKTDLDQEMSGVKARIEEMKAKLEK